MFLSCLLQRNVSYEGQDHHGPLGRPPRGRNPLKGGALITARIALDYGVPVYGVPGDIDRAVSVGTNFLIRDVAFPILGSDDLAEVLGRLEPLYMPHKGAERKYAANTA